MILEVVQICPGVRVVGEGNRGDEELLGRRSFTLTLCIIKMPHDLTKTMSLRFHILKISYVKKHVMLNLKKKLIYSLTFQHVGWLMRLGLMIGWLVCLLLAAASSSSFFPHIPNVSGCPPGFSWFLHEPTVRLGCFPGGGEGGRSSGEGAAGHRPAGQSKSKFQMDL